MSLTAPVIPPTVEGTSGRTLVELQGLVVEYATTKQVVRAVDGVSLTIVTSEPDRFSIALIPYTLDATTLGPLQPGGKVNLETDLLAKYVQRLVEMKE